jgi:hypothetical protein
MYLRSVSHVLDNGGQEQREGVQRHVSSHVDEHPKPHLPIRYSAPEIGHLEFFMLSARLLI